MGVKTILLLLLEIIVGLALLPFLGSYAIVLGLSVAVATFLITRRRRAKGQKQTLVQPEKPISPQRPMRLRQFIGLLWIVALVAILFSPSVLRFGTGGGSSTQLAASFQAVQPYLTSLESKYKLTIVNDTTELQQALSQPGKKAYFLLGPDEKQNLTKKEADMITERYFNGTLSLLLVEGNSTNNPFLHSLFNVEVRGDAIVDNSEHNPFWQLQPEGQIFNVTASIDGEPVSGVIDVASPIIIERPNTMWTVAASSHDSNETSLSRNATIDTNIGPRTIIAANETKGDRAILISDSSPFSTAYNKTWSHYSINETAFTMKLTDWVTHSDPATRIIVDNIHYIPTEPVRTPNFSISLPIGPLSAIGLSLYLRFSNSLYTGFLDATRPYLLGIALFTAWGFYRTLTKRYATERRGKDDEPIPNIEKNILAESKERRDFLKTSRKKGFYVATLDQLYDVLDSLVDREFGAGMAGVSLEQLSSRLGEEQGRRAERLFKRVGNIARYARGEKRLLLPPVIQWKQTTRKLTGQAEQILNQLGLTMTGKTQKKQLDYKLRRC